MCGGRIVLIRKDGGIQNYFWFFVFNDFIASTCFVH